MPFLESLMSYGQVAATFTAIESVFAPSLISIVVAPSVVVAGAVGGADGGLVFVIVYVGDVVVGAVVPVPVVEVADIAVTTVMSLEMTAFVALPPKTAICVEEPGVFNKQMGALGTTLNGCTGAPVPGAVVTAKLVLCPRLSVTVTALGSFKQPLDAGAEVALTVKRPFASRTSAGFAVTIVLDDGETVIE